MKVQAGHTYYRFDHISPRFFSLTLSCLASGLPCALLFPHCSPQLRFVIPHFSFFVTKDATGALQEF